MSALPAIPVRRFQTVAHTPRPAPQAAEGEPLTFPCRHEVLCVMCLACATRVCHSTRDITSWVCEECAKPIHLDRTRNETPEWRQLFKQETDGQRIDRRHVRRVADTTGSAFVDGMPAAEAHVREGRNGNTAYVDGVACQIKKPRALSNELREYPEWTRNPAQFQRVLDRLRTGRNGPQNVMICYWYYRVGLGCLEIAGLLKLLSKPMPPGAPSLPVQPVENEEESVAYWEKRLAEEMLTGDEEEAERLKSLIEKRLARIRAMAARMGFE